MVSKSSCMRIVRGELTWDDISGIHFVLIFDEAKAIHELDFFDGTSSMSFEVFLDILFCDWIG